MVKNDAKVKGFYAHLKSRDLSGRDWMQFPQNELRFDLERVGVNHIVHFMDSFVQEQAVEFNHPVKLGMVYGYYTAYCATVSRPVTFTSPAAFSTGLRAHIPFEECGITRLKSSVIKLSIDRQKTFAWLQKNGHTAFEDCPV